MSDEEILPHEIPTKGEVRDAWSEWKNGDQDDSVSEAQFGRFLFREFEQHIRRHAEYTGLAERVARIIDPDGWKKYDAARDWDDISMRALMTFVHRSVQQAVLILECVIATDECAPTADMVSVCLGERGKQ